MIDKIDDVKVLEAIYTLLFNQTVATTNEDKTHDQEAYEAMIEEGEKDIRNGKVYHHTDVKEHFKQKMNG